MLAEPYKGESSKLPLIAWLTISGWKERWRRWLGGVKSIYTVAKCKKYIKGWSLPEFKKEALTDYERICKMLAAGDLTGLRQVVTPAVFSDLKRELKAREAGGWHSVRWALVERPPLKKVEVVHGRLVAINPKDDKSAFAQLTVRFKSQQTFAAYNAQKELVAGQPGHALAVEDVWVFERALGAPEARWRLAARLGLSQSD
ncbi:hypothetical protein WJX72_005137 [[Myrmecia] bisecta]|uniref:Large ribosomal subunit protein mL45 n=1 Tax=[Myrmecia] bisecta TaxID=41462 RepID=A0AAW1QQF7_9CHLO